MARVCVRLLLALSAITYPATCARVTNSDRVPKQATLLSQVNSLTLRAGHQTASRRVSPVPQLQCIGPSNVCQLHEVDVMRCTNEGSDYDKENIQWSCKASLPEEFKLGVTDVSCEGYESSDDPHVLKGSCGVQYNLLLTDKGEARYAQKVQEPSLQPKTHDTESYAGILFMVVFVAVACVILYGLCMACLTADGGQNAGRLGGGGAGGGFDDNDPPPPYDTQPPRSPPPRKPPQQKKTRASSSRPSAESQQQQGWRPGFWTGAMTGAAAGAYMAGGRQQTQHETTERRPPVGLFGGGGTGTRQPPTPPSSGYTDSTPSYSSSRHESTGFGSTSRR